MTNVQIRAGGNPVASDVLVSVDGTTIQGNGSAQSPLHAVAGAAGVVADGVTIQGEGTEGSPLRAVGTNEVVATNVSTVLDPAIPISFVSRPLAAPAGLTMADPADTEAAIGFVKYIACESSPNGVPGSVAYEIECSLEDEDQIEVTNDGGGVTLIWQGAFWVLVGGFNATIDS